MSRPLSRALGPLLGLFLVLGAVSMSGVAHSTEPAAPATQATQAARKPAASAGLSKTVKNRKRPLMLGLLAAFFLVVGGAIGANDRPDGKSKSPGGRSGKAGTGDPGTGAPGTGDPGTAEGAPPVGTA